MNEFIESTYSDSDNNACTKLDRNNISLKSISLIHNNSNNWSDRSFVRKKSTKYSWTGKFDRSLTKNSYEKSINCNTNSEIFHKKPEMKKDIADLKESVVRSRSCPTSPNIAFQEHHSKDKVIHRSFVWFLKHFILFAMLPTVYIFIFVYLLKE